MFWQTMTNAPLIDVDGRPLVKIWKALTVVTAKMASFRLMTKPAKVN